MARTTVGAAPGHQAERRWDRAVIILNPGAGSGESHSVLSDWCADRSWATLRATRGPGDAAELAARAARQGDTLVVAAGGDGTIHEVVSGLRDRWSRVTLGIVPLGTGNDLARTLELPDDPAQALDVLERGAIRALDLIQIDSGDETRYCANAVAGGFSGAVRDAMDQDVKRRWGPLSYLRSTIASLSELTPYEVIVTIDGSTESYSALNVVVANGAFAAGGIPIAPGADPFDGKLNVAIVREASIPALTLLAPSLLRAEAPDSDLFVTATGTNIRIGSRSTLPMSLDGEALEGDRFHFRVLAGALPVVVPAASPELAGRR